MLIYVPRSKTDQAGEGAWVFIACCEEEAMCPVQALWRLRRLAVQDACGDPVGPVFTAREGKQQRLRKTTVGVRLRKALEKVGVQDWDLYAAHSLRRGGATWAVQQGVSVRQILVMGRWKSDVVRQYLYHSPALPGVPPAAARLNGHGVVTIGACMWCKCGYGFNTVLL